MSPERITPEVATSLADLSGARVQENAYRNYPRHMWSALKAGHYRFALAGVAIAVPLSAAIGIAVSAVMGSMGLALSPLIIPAFIAAGSLMAVEGFGATGAAAASRASGLAERHARILDADAKGNPGLAAYDDKLLVNGRGQHYDFPTGQERHNFFTWKSGLLGAAMGAASGAIIGLSMSAAKLGALESGSVLGTIAHGIAALPLMAGAAPVLTMALAGASAFALFGLTFGIERTLIKYALNHTDANIEGKLAFSRNPDLGAAQAQEGPVALKADRLRRQAEINVMEREYNERISWGALSGRFRGFGGVVPGVILGAIAGAITFAVLPAAGAMVIPLLASAGGLIGMKVFSESGMEAGAEATARAIDNEFDRNRALRAQGITPPAPEPEKESWINGKAMLIVGAVGIVVGLAMFTSLGAGALGIAGIAHATAAQMIAASVVVAGGIGASYGLGYKTLKAIVHPFTRMYDNAVFGHDGSPPEVVPAVAHSVAPSFPAPSLDQVTSEDVALMNQRMAASTDKSFVQSAAPKVNVSTSIQM